MEKAKMGKWLIFSVSLIFIIWAAYLVLFPDVSGITSLNYMCRYFGGRFVVSPLLFSAAFLAIVGIVRPVDARTKWLLALQKAVLFVIAGSVVIQMVHGRYANGTVLPSAFIQADQMIWVVLSICHMFAAIAFCRRG